MEKNKILLNLRGTPEGRFLSGAAYLNSYDGFKLEHNDRFSRAFKAQGASAVERVVKMNPVPNYFVNTDRPIDFYPLPNQAHYNNSLFPPNDVFHKLKYFSIGSSFVYDATISTGLGGCLAMTNSTDTLMTGEAHLAGIRSVHVRGASGRIKFLNSSGSRDGRSVHFGIVNLLPSGGQG